MDKQVEELVELLAEELNWYGNACEYIDWEAKDKKIKEYRRNQAEDIIRTITQKFPLALIDPICTATLKWTRHKATIDSPCDYWDCARWIKAGENYYFEEYGDGQGENFCIECASFFMAQKLSHIIPLADMEVKGI